MLLWNKSQLDLLSYESTCCQAVRRLYKKKNYSEILAVRIFVLLLSMNYIKYQIHNLMGIVANVLKKNRLFMYVEVCVYMWAEISQQFVWIRYRIGYFRTRSNFRLKSLKGK